MELWDEKHPRSLILDQINSQQKIYILPKSIVVLLVNFVIIFPIFSSLFYYVRRRWHFD